MNRQHIQLLQSQLVIRANDAYNTALVTRDHARKALEAAEKAVEAAKAQVALVMEHPITDLLPLTEAK